MKGKAFGSVSKNLRTLFERYKYVLLVIAAGAVLLLVSFEEKPAQTAQRENSLDGGLRIEDLEQRLEDALSQVEGAGEVKVVLTVKSTARQVLAQDGRSVQRGEDLESSLTTVVVSRGSGAQEPVMIQQLSPQYQGALVVCSGGDVPTVRLRIVEAVCALTGLGADKISVCKGK